MQPQRNSVQPALTLAVLLFGLLGVVAFLFGFKQITDADTLWHLKSGELIAQHGPLDQDPFSFRTAGREWIDSQWLFQLVIHLVYRVSDFAGLSIFTGGVIALTWFLLCSIGWDRRSGPITWALLMVALWAASDRLNLRPEILSFLLVAVYFKLLERERLKPTRLVFALVFCQILWANIEGLWPVGLVIIAAYWLEALASRYLSKIPPDKPAVAKPGRLALVLVLCVAASVATPYHLHGFLFPLTLLRQISSSNFLTQNVIEFRPPFAAGDVAFIRLPFLILIALSALSFGLNRRRLRPAHLLLWMALLYLAWTASRNVGLFSISAAVFAAFNFHQYLTTPAGGARWNRLATIRAVSLATGLGLSLFYFIALPANWFYQWDRSYRIFGSGFPADYDLIKAAEFLKQIGWRGKVYSDDITASYLIWAGFPDWKVYVDGRLELYGPELIQDAVESGWDYSVFQREDRRWDFDAAIFTRARSQQPGSLVNKLYVDPLWALIFQDEAVALYLKDTPRQHRLARQYNIDH